MDKLITVNHISALIPVANAVPEYMDRSHIEWHAIDCNNWPEDYPYTPKAEVRMAYTDLSFLIHYRVSEETVRAACGEDNGEVWKDSCVEFFLEPKAGSGMYYNLECNCIGTVLMGLRGPNRPTQHADWDQLHSISRWSTLGYQTFDERPANGPWEVALVVPIHTFCWDNRLGPKMKANFYKCGDGLKKPHFLSWNKIEWEKPNFHLPQFFGNLELGPSYW